MRPPFLRPKALNKRKAGHMPMLFELRLTALKLGARGCVLRLKMVQYIRIGFT